jgi:hypothetical protein
MEVYTNKFLHSIERSEESSLTLYLKELERKNQNQS